MSSKNNIEDFLKDKFTELDSTPNQDWEVFEKKLKRAIWYSRARSVAAFGLFVLALVAGFSSIKNMGETNQWSNQKVDYQIEELKRFDTKISEEEIASQTDSELFIENKVSAKSEISKNKLSISKKELKEEIPLASTVKKQGNSIKQNVKTLAHADNKSAETSTNDEPIKSLMQITEEQEYNAVKKEEEKAQSDIEPAAEENQIQLNKSKNFLTSISPKGLARIIPFETALLSLNNQTKEEKAPKHNMLDLDYARNSAFLLGGPRSIIAPIPVNGYTTAKKGHYISHLQARNPWSYSINVYPNFTFRKFRVDRKKVNLLHRDFVDAIEASESGGFSLNVGLEISRRIGDITYLNGGIEYIKYNTDASFNFTNFRDANINSVTGEIQNYSLKEQPVDIAFTDENNYHYLNFPISLSYQPWASSHIRLNLEAGGSFMYFLGAEGQTIDYTDLTVMDLGDREYRKYLASFSVKVGANYYITDRINFGFEPTLMYFTNTIYTEDMPFYVIPYSVGLNLHMQVKLN